MREHSLQDFRIAVIIPCFNEEGAIGRVVEDFKREIPKSEVYVYDNNSNDATVSEASAAGAIVRYESRQGKGYVVRRMFADIDADIYIMVDGDNTYEAPAVNQLVKALIDENLDMVNAARKTETKGAYRRGHRFGNWMLTSLVRRFFGKHYEDMLSGYRIFSRRFVKSFPLDSSGFEIETELTVHALELEMPSSEICTDYRERSEGTVSKLRTYSDGARILWTIIKLLVREKPMQTFSFVSAVLAAFATLLMYPIILNYLDTGLVPRFPTVILASGIYVLSFLSFACGLILDTVTKGRKEAKRMAYLRESSLLAALAKREL